MIEIKNGNLFDAKEGLICHQVNCKGNMGRGVAKTFKEKYPDVFEHYLYLCHNYTATSLLGNCLFHDNTVCMFAQDDWRGHGCNTNYTAFRNCCKAIIHHLQQTNSATIVNMPYGIGAGLGGGDWLIIYSILEEEFEGHDLILWKL